MKFIVIIALTLLCVNKVAAVTASLPATASCTAAAAITLATAAENDYITVRVTSTTNASPAVVTAMWYEAKLTATTSTYFTGTATTGTGTVELP